ncbi:hypothetical protein [Priestia megaterium]|uniref:hypothetical protein n=1 Tax=Priestia megaterium TaxID=1404 RepID=UPI00211C76C6|nr:hypothetical protein [Priestia megaterium]
MAFLFPEKKGEFFLDQANGELKTYVTSDGQVFKTTLDIGDVNPKLYTLYHLEMAEKRVIAKKNKSLQTALGSTRALAKKNQTSAKVLSEVQFDEYGLDPSIYTKKQIDFVQNKIKEFEATYESSTPFEKETIGMMAGILLKINEVKAKMISTDNEKYVKQLKDLREMFSKMAEDLKLRPKDKKEEDRSKNRNSLAEMVRRYEARKRSQRKESTIKTETMDKMLSEVRTKALDSKYSGAEE